LPRRKASKKKKRIRGRKSFAKNVLGKAQKRCKGKTGSAYKACVRREIKKLKGGVTTKKKPRSKKRKKRRGK
jgi:hypothetical protein